MAEYHVNCGAFAIYAGTVNKKNNLWVNKSEVTDEALLSVATYLTKQAEQNNKNTWGYEWDTTDGKVVELVARIRDKEPTNEG